jgi:hypothetical protein
MKKLIILFTYLLISLSNLKGYSQQIDVIIDGAFKGRFSNGENVYMPPTASVIKFQRVLPYASVEFFNAGLAAFINGETTTDYLGSGSVDVYPSSCDRILVKFYKNIRAANFDSQTYVIINVFRDPPTPTISGPSQLCEGQSGTFSTQYYGGVNYNWSGSGGVSVSPNFYESFVSVNSGGKLFCTISNQCGSQLTIKKLGSPNDENIDVNAPNSVNDGESISIFADNSSTIWTTNHGYFNNNPGSQYFSGQSWVYYTAINTPVNAIFVTQSNSCGTGTKTIAINTNNPSYGNSYVGVEVFPNPVSTTLNLQLPQTDDFGNKSIRIIPEEITLFDKNGVSVRNLKNTELQGMDNNRKIAIDVRNLIPDEYYLHIKDKQGKVDKVRVLIGDKR